MSWLYNFILSFISDILGLLMVAIAIPFSDGQKLPDWAWVWDNDQQPLGDEERGAAIAAATGFRRGWLRYCWLALRNPSHNYSYELGRYPAGVFHVHGDDVVSDQGYPGLRIVWCDNCWCLYWVWRYGSTRCIRAAFGWKIWDLSRDKAQIVGLINPFMTFTELAK